MEGIFVIGKRYVSRMT